MGVKRLGGKRPGGKRLGGETTKGGNGLGAKRPGFKVINKQKLRTFSLQSYNVRMTPMSEMDNRAILGQTIS